MIIKSIFAITWIFGLGGILFHAIQDWNSIGWGLNLMIIFACWLYIVIGFSLILLGKALND